MRVFVNRKGTSKKMKRIKIWPELYAELYIATPTPLSGEIKIKKFCRIFKRRGTPIIISYVSW